MIEELIEEKDITSTTDKGSLLVLLSYQRALITSLRKEIAQCHFENGVLQSELDEKDDTIRKPLIEENKKLSNRLKAFYELTEDEMLEVKKERMYQKLTNKVNKLSIRSEM